MICNVIAFEVESVVDLFCDKSKFVLSGECYYILIAFLFVLLNECFNWIVLNGKNC